VEPDYLLYLEVSYHWTLVCNVAAMQPVIFVPQGGVTTIFRSPTRQGIEDSAPKAKNKSKIAL